MRPNKDHRTEIILYGLLLIPLLFAAAALAQATEQAQGLAEITAVLSEILHTPSMLRWCASTPKFLLAVLVLYDPLTTINNLSDFVFSAIKAIGAILLGFGIVQIGLALKGHDASQRAQGFMTFFGGVVIYFAKDILDMIL